jgi:hypothetical protein
MSLVTEILDRLSGVAVVREKLSETSQKVNTLAAWVLDHEKRLTRLDTLSGVGGAGVKLPKK